MRWPLDREPELTEVQTNDDFWALLIEGERFGVKAVVQIEHIPVGVTPAPEDVDRAMRIMDSKLPGPGKASARPGEPCRRRRHAEKQLAIRINDYEEMIRHMTPSQAGAYRRPGSLSGRK